MTTKRTRTETERGKKGRSSRPVALGKVNLLLALLGLLFLIGAYRLTFLPEALALLVLTVSLVTLVSRAWQARRGGLEYGLLRHPFRRELRPYLLQCLNHWLFWALFGAAILAGTFTLVPALVALLLSLPLPDRIPYQPLVISLGAAALVMAALALIPRRRVQVATNVLVAIGTVFLAIQLVRIYTPPADPLVVDSPLTGEWAMLAGGRSALISHHYRTPIVSNAVDFVRLDEEGRPRPRRRSEAGAGLVRLRRARAVPGRWHGRQCCRRPHGRARRQHRAEALVWQPHPHRYWQWALRRAGAPPAGKRSGQRGRARAARPADRRRRGLGRLVGAAPALPSAGQPRLR
jgi:hypothetical protein